MTWQFAIADLQDVCANRWLPLAALRQFIHFGIQRCPQSSAALFVGTKLTCLMSYRWSGVSSSLLKNL